MRTMMMKALSLALSVSISAAAFPANAAPLEGKVHLRSGGDLTQDRDRTDARPARESRNRDAEFRIHEDRDPSPQEDRGDYRGENGRDRDGAERFRLERGRVETPAAPFRPGLTIRTRGFSCAAGTAKLAQLGFRSIEARDCRGPQYRYRAVRGHMVYRAEMQARSGKLRIEPVRRLR